MASCRSGRGPQGCWPSSSGLIGGCWWTRWLPRLEAEGPGTASSGPPAGLLTPREWEWEYWGGCRAPRRDGPRAGSGLGLLSHSEEARVSWRPVRRWSHSGTFQSAIHRSRTTPSFSHGPHRGLFSPTALADVSGVTARPLSTPFPHPCSSSWHWCFTSVPHSMAMSAQDRLGSGLSFSCCHSHGLVAPEPPSQRH